MSGAGEISRSHGLHPAAEAAKPVGPASWADSHTRSEELAAAASILARQGRTQEAEATYRRAAQLEEAALETAAPEKVRTLGITAVSAAALWLKGNDLYTAASLANRELARGHLPEFAATQLHDLLAQVAEKEVVAGPAYDAGAMVYQDIQSSLYDRGYNPDPGAPAETAGFTVTLKDVGRNKIDVIEVIGEVTGLSLKEAKELVESAPVVVKADANEVEAAEINAKIQAAGAVAIVK